MKTQKLQKLARLEKKIAETLRLLAETSPMRPGKVSCQYRDPKTKKRPFFQISYTYRMRSRSEYVRPENLDAIQKECANFKRFRTLCDQLVEDSLLASQMRIQIANETRANLT